MIAQKILGRYDYTSDADRDAWLSANFPPDALHWYLDDTENKKIIVFKKMI